MSGPTTSPPPLELLGDLVASARKAGAEAADAVLIDSVSLSVGMRLGELERLERAEAGDIGLRVLLGRRQAFVSSSDRSPAALAELVERAVAMARIVPEDPYCGLAEPGQLAQGFPELDDFDPFEPNAEMLIDMVRRGEDAARAVDGITNSEGAEAGWGRSGVAIVASNGFGHAYSATSSSLSVSVLAGDAARGMERDYDHTSAVYLSDLRRPEDVGHEAGRRAVHRLGGRKVATRQVPVILDPRVARGLLSSLAGAINGAGVARGTSFLKDRLGQQVFAKGIRVIDDPHRQRGLRSRPCDGEGLPTRCRAVIEDGTAEMIHDVPDGFYVTELFGQGVNGVTGDYSRGAAGFWISGGEIAFPVSEVTVAGNLKDMFLNLTPANDLELRHGVDCPTLRIDGLTVAGR
ncbi:MAG: PmbA protein [bacterium]|nr:MAG: PmbA protein [bacterium]